MELDEDTLLHFAILTLGLRAVLNVGCSGSGNGLPRTSLAIPPPQREPRVLKFTLLWT
jgi:hypothetical protein